MKKIIFALITGLAIAGGAFLLSRPEITFISGRSMVKATGRAEITLPADEMRFTISLSARVKDYDQLAGGTEFLKHSEEVLTEKLKAEQISREQFTVHPIQIREIYSVVDGKMTNEINTLVLTRSFTVSAPARPEADNLPGKLSDAMLKEGIFAEISPVSYTLNSPEKLENDLIYQATEDAFRRANDIAGASGSEVGKLISSSASDLELNSRGYPLPVVTASMSVTLELETEKYLF